MYYVKFLSLKVHKTALRLDISDNAAVLFSWKASNMGQVLGQVFLKIVGQRQTSIWNLSGTKQKLPYNFRSTSCLGFCFSLMYGLFACVLISSYLFHFAGSFLACLVLIILLHCMFGQVTGFDPLYPIKPSNWTDAACGFSFRARNLFRVFQAHISVSVQ